MSYCFARCKVHPAFDDVQGWFLEVRGDDPQLLTALHKGITAKYCSMLGQDSHGYGADATRLAALGCNLLKRNCRKATCLSTQPAVLSPSVT